MKFLKINLLAVMIWLCCLPSGFAQRTENYKSPQYEFKTAMDLFNKEKYGSAQQYFKYVYENTEDKQQDLKTNSLFYMGVCAAKLDNQDAAYYLQGFIDQYPVHSFVPEAHFYLGKYYFSRKQWKKVITQFEQLMETEIQPENMAEYNFKMGYSYLMVNEDDLAKSYFKKAREQAGPYKKKAIYYSAVLAYQNGQYEAALEDFLTLRDEPEYRKDASNYLTQIYFKQGEYEKVLKVAPAVTDNRDTTQLHTLRCVAVSNYTLNNYEKAVDEFDELEKANRINLSREDHFAAGFSYYREAQYDKAITHFSKAIDTKTPDAMTQNAYYLIGDCYRRAGQYALAIQSFKEAAKYDFNADIKEDALYNYAKLQCQTSTSPFNNGIDALQEYINTYPHSARSEEASSYLSKLYMSTKNYQAAITSIEKLSTKTPSILQAYQRCTYFRALELLNNGNNKEAIKYLDKSLSAPRDPQFTMNATYWKGEAQYRNEQYQDAYYTIQSYQKRDGAIYNENYNNSFYTLGYAALKIKRYKDAANAFRSFIQKSNDPDHKIKADALARLGDCYFMQQDLKNAIKYYEDCEQMHEFNCDYAIYQQSKCYGYQKNNTKKIAALERLIANNPNTSYRDDADYDLAVTYHTQNDYQSAIAAYKEFIRQHPKSTYIRQAHTRLAQAYLNNGNTDLAISTYKYVVETYPGSREAKDAMTNLENIYTEEGNTSEFFDYVRSKNMNISADRQDSIAFKAAEAKYQRGDCEASIKACADYLRQFPSGSFAAKALFYKAECEYGQRSYQDALADYEQIIKKYKTEYNVTALHKAASILYNDKQYTKALTYFNKLAESTTDVDELIYANNGAMRSAYFMQDYAKALKASEYIIQSNANDLLNEALLIAGNSAMNQQDYAKAKTYYSQLEKRGSNDLCAEAAYHLAEIALNQDKDLTACEKQIQDILSKDYSSEYWYAKTFILYGDLYLAKGNTFQARHTYQSIVDNYEGADLVELARQRIAEVDAIEAANPSNH
ncbi:MAG: tetratricopeptide repeat protein [Bacteroidales bacterium]|nr:tetratricopeptide repeat protein [Bacteroidales bacterium]